MKYQIGTKLEWRDQYLNDQYGIEIINIYENTHEYMIEWTALEDGVEKRKKGEKWRTKWKHKLAHNSFNVVRHPNVLPEDLFTL